VTLTRLPLGYATALGSVTVVPGGQDVVAVTTNKDYIAVVAQGIGYASMSVMFNGMQYFGQLDLDVTGKTGFGKDTDALTAGSDLSGGNYDNRQGIGQYSADQWPE